MPRPAPGNDDWKHYPDRLDLYVYQGDDIRIPLYFVDASQPTLDMSTWTWKAQARIYHRYYAEQSHDFIIDTELITPDGAGHDQPDVGDTVLTPLSQQVRGGVLVGAVLDQSLRRPDLR